MLNEIFEKTERYCDLLARAGDKETIIDEENNRALNRARLPNPYFTRVLRESEDLVYKHPILSFFSILIYNILHPEEAVKAQNYFEQN